MPSLMSLNSFHHGRLWFVVKETLKCEVYILQEEFKNAVHSALLLPGSSGKT